MTEPELSHHINTLTALRFQALARWEQSSNFIDAADVDRYTLALQKAYDEWAKVTGTRREIVD